MAGTPEQNILARYLIGVHEKGVKEAVRRRTIPKVEAPEEKCRESRSTSELLGASAIVFRPGLRGEPPVGSL